MLHAARHDEQLALRQRHHVAAVQLDAELALPADEQLILVVMMPRKRAFDSREADDGIVDLRKVARLPRLGDRGRDVGERLTTSH